MGRAAGYFSGSFAASTPHFRVPADHLQELSGARVKQVRQANCVGPTLRLRPSLWARPAAGEPLRSTSPHRLPPLQHPMATTPQSCRGSKERIRVAVYCL
ncbi:hypothetical protein NDU88_005796 [Pleurodeles waltl]|uniref:Uncharacterized protein n=1 Tax=Pleurodeles waltl TaxID=8319 RepID=A0AAV7WCG2_PLEWA|nr:hypothetical protein NDU88_005796 [Pleurodeles waltl]